METRSFKECLADDTSLANLRREYESSPPEERRMAADWEYHSAAAGSMFNDAIALAGMEGLGEPEYPSGYVALAIDPSFAPALLTVGSVEYQQGRKADGMELFMALTALPADEPDLDIIIDKAAFFLLDSEDHGNALNLYMAAEKAFPDNPSYPCGLSYVYSFLDLHDLAVEHAKRAVELAPTDHELLNDLGVSLREAGQLEEAAEALKQAIALSDDDYPLARNNLEEIQGLLNTTDPTKD